MQASDQHENQDPRGERRDEAARLIRQLTPKEREVLKCVHSGLLNKQIAHRLGMAEATVKTHMTALMRKLEVRNRTQAAILAGSLGS